LKIVVDQNIRAARETFGAHADLVFMDGRAICRDDLLEADALIVRTTTRVGPALLQGTPVGFVGSTSIGTDHLDIDWLESAGIAWANAPGCNADSAAQYTLAMIWLACKRLGRSLPDMTAGVIGRGNVGSRVQKLLETLGVPVVANDPPLTAAGVAGLVGLDDALARDIVCLHVPLTREGPCPTHRMIAAAALGRMRDGALLVNTARGDVVDGTALLAELQSGRLHAALDVWPGEPRIDAALLLATCVATPHVAGYSDDGKRNGTLMVYAAFCRWAGLQAVQSLPELDTKPPLQLTRSEDALDIALDASCFVRSHDAALRALAPLSAEHRAAGFDRLRRDYPKRRDFKGWRVHTMDTATATLFRALGFQAAPAE
jgi:erythronate-4-phosphate dehydrogenase